MNLQTFQAETMAQALAQVKHSLGSDAVILHTRTFHRHRWLGLRRMPVVEITAGQGPRPVRHSMAAATARQRDVTPRPPADHPGRQLLQTPVAQAAAMAAVAQEMSALKTMVKDLVAQTRANGGPNFPEDLLGFYMQMVENQVADIIKTLQTQLRPEHWAQKEFVRHKLCEQLEKLIPSAGPIHRVKKQGPHVIALIGPTGVGKTTTIAKLAAHLKLRQRRRIGLITIDTYRIAAIDQLRKYAEILGAPLRAVATAEDFR
jgi:flagellar biosynthesis protein FlhF